MPLHPSGWSLSTISFIHSQFSLAPTHRHIHIIIQIWWHLIAKDAHIYHFSPVVRAHDSENLILFNQKDVSFDWTAFVLKKFSEVELCRPSQYSHIEKWYQQYLFFTEIIQHFGNMSCVKPKPAPGGSEEMYQIWIEAFRKILRNHVLCRLFNPYEYGVTVL